MTARVLKGIKFGALNNLQTITAYDLPSLAQAKADDKFQFQQHGYFVADPVEHKDGKVVFNKITGLKDRWTKQLSEAVTLVEELSHTNDRSV